MGNGFNLSLKKAIRDGLIPGRYRIELNQRAISLVAITTAVGTGSLAIDDLPLKHLFIRGVRAQLSFVKQDTNLIATWSGLWALGTVPAAADATLTGTEADLFPSTAIGPAVAGVFTSSPAVLATEKSVLWGASDEVNLNLIANAADITDGATAVVKVSGFVDLYLGMI